MEADSEAEEESPKRYTPSRAQVAALILTAVLAIPVFAILNDIFPNIVSEIFGLALPVTALMIYGDYTRRSGERAADSARERLREAAAPTVVYQAHEGGKIVFEGRDLVSGADLDALEADQTGVAERKILIEMYSQRVGQAQTWFRTSIAFGALGATVLLTGIILAIFHATSTGQRYAAIIASSASVISNIIALMFFRQSNIAQQVMAVQVKQIQDSMKRQRETAEARYRLAIALNLVEKIDDAALRDERRSEIATALADVKQKKHKSTASPET